jgi:proteic killer suppression protein
MIASIRHKGLRLYYEKGNGSKLPKEQLPKIRRLLSMLDAVMSDSDIISLGSGVHKLKGEYAGFWALTITGNYRLIFRYDAGDIWDIDYLDYH